MSRCANRLRRAVLLVAAWSVGAWVPDAASAGVMTVSTGMSELTDTPYADVFFFRQFNNPDPYTVLERVDWTVRAGMFAQARLQNSGSFQSLGTINANTTVSFSNPTNPAQNLASLPLFGSGSTIIFPNSSSSVSAGGNLTASGTFPGNELGIFRGSGELPVIISSSAGSLSTSGGTRTSASLESLGSIDITYTYNVLGDTQDDPIYPTRLINGVFVFDNVPSGRWFDPDTANGYLFATLGAGEVFTGIQGLPTGFKQPFTIALPDRTLGQFGPGETVLFPAGVTQFLVYGIDPATDPSDFTAFPINLSFNRPTATFGMLPVTVDIPEPLIPGCVAALVVVLASGRRHRQRGSDRVCSGRPGAGDSLKSQRACQLA